MKSRSSAEQGQEQQRRRGRSSTEQGQGQRIAWAGAAQRRDKDERSISDTSRVSKTSAAHLTEKHQQYILISLNLIFISFSSSRCIKNERSTSHQETRATHLLFQLHFDFFFFSRNIRDDRGTSHPETSAIDFHLISNCEQEQSTRNTSTKYEYSIIKTSTKEARSIHCLRHTRPF